MTIETARELTIQLRKANELTKRSKRVLKRNLDDMNVLQEEIQDAQDAVFECRELVKVIEKKLINVILEGTT